MNKATLLKVGIIVSFTLAALVWGVSFLKGKGTFKKEHTFYAIYERIDGMAVGSPVYLSGYNIGQVSEIYFTPDTSGSLTVEFYVDQEVLLPKTTTARIFSNDLMGNKAIELLLGSGSDLHQSGDTMISDFEGSLKDMVSVQMIPIKNQAESLMEEMEEAINIIKNVFDDTTINNLNNTFQNMDSIISDSKDKVGNILSNIESVSTMMKDNNEEISNAISNVSSLSDSLMAADIKQTIINTNHTMDGIAEITAKINNGEGSIGLLVNNDTLYHNLENATYNLNILLEDMKENPSRYVNVSVFGGKDKK